MLEHAVRIGPDLTSCFFSATGNSRPPDTTRRFMSNRRRPCSFCWKAGSESLFGNLRILQEQLAERPEQLSPNALLRPVVQDYMLPTAAYIGGPAELAYFAQSQVLYERLLGHMPRLVSRSGFTLFDSARREVDGAVSSFDRKDFFHGEEAVRERIASRLVPEGLEQRFEEVTASTEQSLDELQQAILPMTRRWPRPCRRAARRCCTS